MKPSLSFAIVGLATAMLGATLPLRATTVFSGNAGNLGNDQFAHPAPRSYAFVDLLAARSHQPLSVLKITPSGKILLGMGTVIVPPNEPTGCLLGYIWDRGEFLEIRSPAWPWHYGSLGPDPSLSFMVTDINDAGAVVGECRGAYVPEGWFSSLEEHVGVIWPPGQLASPQELDPGVATPAARLNRPYPDGGPYFANFRGIRIDDTGTCYGIGTASDFYDDHYKEDVIRWVHADASPESLTQNALPGLFKRSGILDVSPGGNVLLFTKDYPTYSVLHEVLRRDSPGRRAFPAGYAYSGVTESGSVLGAEPGMPQRILLQDSSGQTTELAGRFLRGNYAQDILARHARKESGMLWTWQQTGGETEGYFPRYPSSTRGAELGSLLQNSPVRFGLAGQFAGTGAMNTNLQGMSIPANERYRPLLYMPASLTVDADNNGHLDEADEGRTSPAYPLRRSSNQDDDAPGTTPQADYLNNTVDGAADLADLFPLFLDIKQLLGVLPPSSGHRYKLKRADGGLNFAYTSLTRETAFDYLIDTSSTYGPNADQAAAVATTQQITAAGVELPAAFLTRIHDQDQGVILLELRGMTAAPLRLVVEKDGTEIAEVAVHIATGEIEWVSQHTANPVEEFKVPAYYADYTTKPLGWLEGLRYFVDGASDTAQAFRIRINVKVRMAGAAGKTVELKAFDVDDPTPANWDPDNVVDAGGLAGDDNRSGGAYPGDNGSIHEGTFSSAFLKTTSVTLDANGEATAEFILSQRPGNNYRIAGVLNESASQLDTLQVTNATASRYVTPEAKPLKGFGGVTSPTLTIWRKLHVEIDSMEAIPTAAPNPELNFVSGTIFNYVENSPANGKSILVLDILMASDETNRFSKGKITLSASGAVLVDGNEYNSLSSYNIITNQLITPNPTGQAFLLVDDDNNYMSEASLSAAVPQLGANAQFITAIASKLAPAYIQPVDCSELGLNPRPTIAFKLNEPEMHLGGASAYDDSKDTSDTPYFWAHTVVFGYQPARDHDFDPATEPIDMGGTPDVAWTGFDSYNGISAIFMESHRERVLGENLSAGVLANPAAMASYNKLYRYEVYGTVMHEMAHAPGKETPGHDHDEGGLMQAGGGSIVMDFFPVTILRFRGINKWGTE